MNSRRIAAMPLAPLMEEPSLELMNKQKKKKEISWNKFKGLVGCRGFRIPDLRLLVGVLGCPLAPLQVPHGQLPKFSLKNRSMDSSSAQYIVHQYIASTGCRNIQKTMRSTYVMGHVNMAVTECDSLPIKHKRRSYSTTPSTNWESGCFVMWQMNPDIWSMELALGDTKVRVGSDGRLVWRHVPWFGSHAAKGPVRPLRRSLQGLDPISIAKMFAHAKCVGEKRVGEEECFMLKLSATTADLVQRSEGGAEIIKHDLLGYFGQRTGLLVFIEDSHLTRIDMPASTPVYWETTMETSIGDYKDVDGVMIAHSGKSVVTILRFGESVVDRTKTRMEESWSIHDFVFNVHGLSPDDFIPPSEITESYLYNP